MSVTLNANGDITASGTISADVTTLTGSGTFSGSGQGTWELINDDNNNSNGVFTLGQGTWIMSISAWTNATSSASMAGTAIINNTANDSSDTNSNIQGKQPNVWPKSGSKPIAIDHKWYASGTATVGSNVCTTVTITSNTGYRLYAIGTGNGGYFTYNITKIA